MEKTSPQGSVQPAVNLIGVAVVGVGLLAASFGAAWYDTADLLLTGYSFTQFPETYLPYWPFEPYLPLFVIAFGAFLTSRATA